MARTTNGERFHKPFTEFEIFVFMINFFDTKVAGGAIPVDRIHKVERFLFGSTLCDKKIGRLFFLFLPEFGGGKAGVFFEKRIERRFGVEAHLVQNF